MKYLKPLNEMYGFENDDDSTSEENVIFSELEEISDHITPANKVPDSCLHDQLGAMIGILDKHLGYNNYVLVPDTIDIYYKEEHIKSQKVDKFTYNIEDEGISTNYSAEEKYPEFVQNENVTSLFLWEIKGTDIKGAYYDLADSSVRASDVYFSGNALTLKEYEKVVQIPISIIKDDINKTVEIIKKDIDLTPFINAKNIGLIE